jgi:hypothetical protein
MITFLTFYALFFDDLRLAVFSKEDDFVFNVLTLLTLAIFVSEIILTSISKDGYFLSFFFWLDLIATVSLIADVEFIMNLISR